MNKPKIIENKRINKGLFKVVIELNNEKMVGYVDDDGYFDDLYRLDENGNDIKFNNYQEKIEFYQKYIGIFEEMENNYEIGFGGPSIESGPNQE